MAALNRAQILGARDRRVARVHVPEWAENGTSEVCIRPLSAEDGVMLSRLSAAGRASGGDWANDYAMRALVAMLCDEDGEPLFTEDDIPALLKKERRVIERLAEEVMIYSGLWRRREEDPEKNSQPTPTGASPSG